MTKQESLSDVVQRLRETKGAERLTAKALTSKEDSSRKEKELLELQNTITPIISVVADRLSWLENEGAFGLIDQTLEVYGKERIWQQEKQMAGIPLSTLRNWIVKDPNMLAEEVSGSFDFTRGVNVPNLDWSTRSENDLRNRYPNKLNIARNDPGAYVNTKILFSKIAKPGESKELDLAVLERDMAGAGESVKVDGYIDLESRKKIYYWGARIPKRLGLQLEVTKILVDDSEFERVDLNRFNRPINTSLYEVTRRTDFVLFENKPSEITIKPHGFSKERKFNLRQKTAIEDMRNYLGEVITDGGDISAVSHTDNLPFVQAPQGPLLIF